MIRCSLLALTLALVACGGGGSGNVNQPPTGGGGGGGSQVQIDTLRFPDMAQMLDAASFDLPAESFTPRAVALRDNTLYVANDLGAASIERYDLAQQRKLERIDGFNMNGTSEVITRMQDLSIYKDRLYTASLSSNRVDIYQLDESKPRIVMSLGTGSWSGDASKVLVHPIAVAANEQYVFAADTHSRISVWKQSDATPANHKKAVKHAYLSLPGCGSIYCDVKLTALGDRLFANFSNGDTLAYDVAKLPASTTLVQPVMSQNGISNRLHHGADGKLYAARPGGGIDSVNPARLPDSGSQILPAPDEQFRRIHLQGTTAEQNIGKARDLAFDGERLAMIQSDRHILLAPLRQVIMQSGSEMVNANEYQEATVAADKRTLMLQDGESWDTLTNPDLRSFRIDRILSGRADKQALHVSSYSAVPVSDLQIQARLKNGGPWFVLGRLDRLPAFSQLQLDGSVRDAVRYPRADGQGHVSFSGLNASQILPSDSFEVRLTSDTDSHVQKLGNFKMKWDISFGKYNDSDSSWRKINPLYAREWVIMITNFAYILNSPEYEHIWFNHKQVMGHDFYGNTGNIDAPGGIFKAEDYTRYWNEIMNRGGIRLGVTAMGGGLGGGDVLGIDTWFFYSHYFNADIGIIGHEFGHHFGGHDSAWANESFGLQRANLWLHQYFQRKGQLPYMDPDLNKFHLAPSDQLYNGIDENMRKPRPASDVNRLEHYFAENPL